VAAAAVTGRPRGRGEASHDITGPPSTFHVKASGGNGFGLLGVRGDRVVTETFEEVHEPPPSPRGFDGDRRVMSPINRMSTWWRWLARV